VTKRTVGTRRSTAGIAGMCLLALLSLVGAVGLASRTDPFAIVGAAFVPPGSAHAFGTDDLGRDVFAGVVHGAAVSLAVGFASAALAVGVGVLLGGLAGSEGGFTDALLMRITEFAQALPRFFLVITLVNLFGGRLWFIVAALGLTAWPSTARMFRAQVLSLRSRDFVTAAKASGEHDVAILRRHILPLALPVLAAQISYQAGGAILAEAGLSFLGLGDPNVITWGAQLGAAQHFVREAWWMSVFPGIAITLTVLSCNLIADSLTPRNRSRRVLF
jgi:peptide/nickel transport system permease protein